MAELAFSREQKAPCPALISHPDGTTSCELVVIESRLVEKDPAKVPMIAQGLGIGLGCGMADNCPDVDYENQCAKTP